MYYSMHIRFWQRSIITLILLSFPILHITRKIFLWIFILLIIGCTNNKKKGNNSEGINIQSRISQKDSIIKNDTLSFDFLYSKADSNDSIKMYITRFDGVLSGFPLRIMKVMLDNASEDTLDCINYTYQINKNDLWEEIPHASEDLGWKIWPKEKSYNDYGLPSEYIFSSGLYRMSFTFTKNSNNRNPFNIDVYFELKGKK